MTAPGTAIFVIGPRDTIEDVNDAACALLGYPRESLVGLHGSELIPAERQAATAVSLDRMRLGTAISRDGILKHRNGTLVEVEVEGRALAGSRLSLEIRKRTSA